LGVTLPHFSQRWVGLSAATPRQASAQLQPACGVFATIPHANKTLGMKQIPCFEKIPKTKSQYKQQKERPSVFMTKKIRKIQIHCAHPKHSTPKIPTKNNKEKNILKINE
jgi:hypothetical protein